MPCPYFHPRAPRVDAADPQSAMLPLGGAWTGACRAIPDQPWQPESPGAERRCNLGYARGECPRFPALDGPDAIRFTINRDEGDSLRLYYVAERDHHPFAHGPLEYSVASGAIAGTAGASEILAAQAAAYAASYLRRKSEAAAARGTS
jgi:hypothetical protein